MSTKFIGIKANYTCTLDVYSELFALDRRKKNHITEIRQENVLMQASN
jgi:hypothetical protein